jgi:hypothetical protein
VGKIADELWGRCDSTSVLENADGKGRVVWGKSLAEVFAAQNLKPDFECQGASAATRLACVHRVAGEADIYFVSNQRRQFNATECTFRVSGKVPELWHPDTGVIEPAPVWSAQDGRTTVRLDFEPAGSVFVIFRHATDGADHVVAISGSFATEPASAPRLEIQRAVYAADDGAGELDVTAKLSELARDGQVIAANNDVLGRDPAYGHVKHLRVEYTFDGKPGIATADEGGTLTLPGAMTTVRLPQEVTGAWDLSFPPDWGAPPSVTLEKLISWTSHTNDGVRYFSGTAAYDKEIEISADRLSAGRELWLDLGAVKNFAEVSLNGRDFGVLWKPPFRVNITAAAKPGVNKLVVKVTNLWPNRLIGDEQLPPDVQWNGKQLKAWPQWFLDGKPSPTGRLTFTTWHHWTKDSPLLESGLLGPVTLQTSESIAAK